MKGIQYMMNDNGDRTAVVIDLKKYGNIWEDFYDNPAKLSFVQFFREAIRLI
ncbi:MAG: hypothetical protein HQK98_11515 [Nitrospirae bacterium]|nr:hypothetical protein [Nitrospirota bacterium]